MKVFVEFAHMLTDLTKKTSFWVEIPGEGITLKDFLLKTLPNEIGEEASNRIFELFNRKEIFVFVNGRVVWELDHMLNDLDKIYFIKIAFGG